MPLVDRGLPEALTDVVSDWSSISGLSASVTTTGTVEPLHPEVEIAVLRVTQEALANAAIHSGASRVGVTLSYMGDIVTLDVRDDGPGSSRRESRTGTGPATGSVSPRCDSGWKGCPGHWKSNPSPEAAPQSRRLSPQFR